MARLQSQRSGGEAGLQGGSSLLRPYADETTGEAEEADAVNQRERVDALYTGLPWLGKAQSAGRRFQPILNEYSLLNMPHLNKLLESRNALIRAVMG